MTHIFNLIFYNFLKIKILGNEISSLGIWFENTSL